MNQLKGSCHCGAIQYSIDGKSFDGDYCHCRDCQKITGSPISAWMDFKVEQINWVNNKPKEYHSSKFIRRGFCELCGSTLSYRHTDHPKYTTLTITSLDNPNLAQPTYHIHTKSQVEWLTISDDLPRYHKSRK